MICTKSTACRWQSWDPSAGTLVTKAVWFLLLAFSSYFVFLILPFPSFSFHGLYAPSLSFLLFIFLSVLIISVILLDLSFDSAFTAY